MIALPNGPLRTADGAPVLNTFHIATVLTFRHLGRGAEGDAIVEALVVPDAGWMTAALRYGIGAPSVLGPVCIFDAQDMTGGVGDPASCGLEANDVSRSTIERIAIRSAGTAAPGKAWDAGIFQLEASRW